MSGSDTEEPSGPQSIPHSPLVDQGEIDAFLARAEAQKTVEPAVAAKLPVPEPPSAPFQPGNDLGLPSQDEIDSQLVTSKQNTETEAVPQASPPAAPDKLEIDRLLAAADAEPTNFVAAEAALRSIDQAEIDAMHSSGTVTDTLGDDAPLVKGHGNDDLDSQHELDKQIASADLETQLGGGESDAVLAASEPAAPPVPAIIADSAPVTLGQEELDALLGAHPMGRAEPLPPLPIAQASEEDPVDRAERENTRAGIGRENLAAAVPDPAASEQPLGQDLIDSLLAQAAQAAPSATPQDREMKEPDSAAVSLSDDDFADMGISMPTPQVSIVSDPVDAPHEAAEVDSPVVQRRLRRGSRFPAKIAAAIAASLLAGFGTFAYLWSHRTLPVEPASHVEEVEHLDLKAVIALARDLMGKGEYMGAMRELGAALRRAEAGPLLDEARFIHVEAGYRSLPSNPKDVDIETVLKNIEDVIALAPEYARNPEALAWKAEIYERTGALTTARDTYDRIISTYPTAPDIDNTLLQHARVAAQLNYFDDAERSLDRIINDHPQSPHKSEAQMMLAKGYELTGRTADAQAVYTSVASERTESRVGAEAALALARVANAAGDLPGAIRALETRLQTATTIDGNDAIYVELAKAYRSAGKPADAVRIARELLNFFPDSSHVPEAVVEMTRALEANGESRQALELAHQAAERFDKNADIAKNRAMMLGNTGDTRAAAEALEKADQLGANDPAVLLDSGQKYLELAESEKAVEILQRVIEKYPDSVQAVDAGVELGRYEYKSGDIAGAIDRLAALAESPNASGRQLAIQSALGDIYTDLGLKKRATLAYEKVASLAIEPETLARASIVLLKNGAMGSALPVIQKVDTTRLSSKTGFGFLMAQGRAMLELDPDAALGKMQQAFEQYPVERMPEDFEYLVRASLETGKTARARVLVTDLDVYVQTHPEERKRLQRTAALWGDALYNAGDFRGALDAYALAIPPDAPPVPDGAASGDAQTDEPSPPTRDAIWAKFQRANAMLKLDDFSNSLPILDDLAAADTPYAEDARIKAQYARLEQRLRGERPVVGEGG